MIGGHGLATEVDGQGEAEAIRKGNPAVSFLSAHHLAEERMRNESWIGNKDP